MAVVDNNLDTVYPNNGTGNVENRPRDDAAILAYLNQCYSIAKNNRLQFEKQWYMNLAFFCGRQYVQWLTAGPMTRLYEPAAPSWRVRLVTNHVRRYVRKEIAKMIQEKPVGFVLPASSDDSDLLAARAGDAIIEHEWREKMINREIRRAAFWNSVCGNGFIKDYWNVGIGTDSKKNKGQKQGDTVVENVTPYHIFIADITIEDIESQPYVIHESSKDRHWVKNQWGVDIPEIKDKETSAPLEQKFLQAMGLQNPGAKKDTCYVREIWIKPGGKYPQGAWAVFTESQLIEIRENEWPLPHKEYPFTKIDNIPSGRFYNESGITDLIPLQKEYNRTRSQTVEAKNKMAAPQMLAQRGSLDASKLTSQPGLVIFYKPGYEKPTYPQPPELPSYVLQEPEKILSDMDHVMSQHEVSRGQVPAGVEAATAISYLQEQDDTSIQAAITSIEEGAEKIGRHLLHFANAYWDDERKIKVVGLNNQMEAFEFSKSNLEGNTDYIVQAGSATPRSAAAKRAWIKDMMDSGYIPPERGLKYLEMNEVSRLYEEMQIDARQAQRESIKMTNGIMVSVNTWDVDPSHVFEHDNYRKRQEFETLPVEIKSLHERHITEHKLRYCSLLGYDLSAQMYEVDPQTMQPVVDETTGQPSYNTMLIDSVYFRLTNGIQIGDPNAVGPGASEET